VSLVARQARFRYGSDEPWVVNGADLEVAPGVLLGLIGPNGAGKSTLVRLLSGVARPLEGEVLLDGEPLAAQSRRASARAVAVVSQSPVLPEGFRVVDVVAMGRAPHGGFLRGERTEDLEAIARAFHATDLWHLRTKQVQRLSGGERQRVALARALAQEPSYLLLDEPTSHLDVRYQLEVLDHAHRATRQGLGVLAVLHDLNLAAHCDRLVLMSRGVIAADGSPDEVLVEEVLVPIYRAPLHVARVDGRPVVVPGRSR
jgi:iron complex transport system ATP-binding protein